jgi:transposase-like protein
LTRRTNFTASEKAKIALEALKEELTLAQICSKYGVQSSQINKWKKEVLAHMPEAFTNKSQKLKRDHEAELSGLYEKIGRLKVENDFLKKKFDALD